VEKPMDKMVITTRPFGRTSNTGPITVITCFPCTMSGLNMRQALKNVTISREINLISRAKGDICVVTVVVLQVSEKFQHLVLSNTKVFIHRRISRTGFSNHQDIQFFRNARKCHTQRSYVLRERDNISTALVLPPSADPHDETGGGETTEHLLHLREAEQDASQVIRNDSRVGFVFGAVPMMSRLGPVSRRKQGSEEKAHLTMTSITLHTTHADPGLALCETGTNGKDSVHKAVDRFLLMDGQKVCGWEGTMGGSGCSCNLSSQTFTSSVSFACPSSFGDDVWISGSGNGLSP
jgi:hypothetical protein